MEKEIDEERVDEAVLALLYLTTFRDKPCWRAWKSHNWDSLDRLHQKGYISNPATLELNSSGTEPHPKVGNLRSPGQFTAPRVTCGPGAARCRDSRRAA